MDFLPGLCQGIARVTISYPFDALKVFCQTNGQTPWRNLRTEFVRNPTIFYRGVGVPMVTVSLDRAIQYRYFEQYRTRFNPYLLGAVLGCFSSILSVPMQFITSNVILTNKSEYGSMSKYLRETITSRGIGTLFKGFTVEVPRAALATGVYLGTYGHLREMTKAEFPDSPMMATSVSAIGSSWSSWITVFPLDTVRTLYQVEKDQSKSLSQIIQQRYSQQGLLSFWRGLSPVLLRTAPSAVGGMIVYEHARAIFSIEKGTK